MYRSDLDTRHKGGAIAGVVAIHAALALALLHLSGTVDLTDVQQGLSVFDVTEVPPPPEIPPPPPPSREDQRARPKETEGGSPKNIKSEAAPLPDPKPQVKLPPTPAPPVSDTPRQGSGPTQGAADVRGLGTGAGGAGNGTGTGSGNGSGGGGDGGVAVPAGLIRGITGRDYPQAVRRSWPRGGMVFLRLRIEPSGRPSKCDVMRSYGDPAADQLTCSLVMQRGQFRPARNARGTPVAAWLGYVQSDRNLR